MKTQIMQRGILLLNLVLSVAPAQAQTAVQAWVRHYNGGYSHNGATAIAVDGDGNVFVTGYSDRNSSSTNLDCATIKYSNAGVPLWTNRYVGPGGLSSGPTGIAVDKGGNVFVTGVTYLYRSPSLSPTDYRYTTVAYSGAGVPLWTNLFGAPGNGNARAVAVATDSNSNVYVTGNSQESTNSQFNMTTIAYSRGGVPLWTNRYKGPGLDGESRATSLAVDANGRVFVTGYSYGIGSYSDYTTLAYSSAGMPLWTNWYNGPGNSDDWGDVVAVDAAGNVVVAGTSYGTNGFYDYATVAYSNTGLPLWTNRYSTGNASDTMAMSVDRSGNVFVTGHSWNTVGWPDYATAAYSVAGVPLWTNRYDGPVQRDDAATAVAVDGNGNVFVTGYSTGPVTNYNYLTIAYSSNGTPLWTNRCDERGQAAAIAVDNLGNVFVTGVTATSSGGSEYATIKYSVSVPLFMQKMNSQVVLSWTNAAFGWTNLGFQLQSAPAIADTFTTIAGATSPYTNSITAGQQFFRLISN